MALSQGQTLGPYQIVEPLGRGGMATVYKAYHSRLDRYVAIKMLHSAAHPSEQALARFEREAKIVARLEHPHIVQVYDFSEYNGQPYLVMKFVEGESLKTVMHKSPLPVDETLRIMKPVADALDYAHQNGVLHRDIKPANILIEASGVPYLTDFGLARIAQLGESSLSQDVMIGTPFYIAPEQAMGSKNIDSRSDIYSLGVVLYEMVTGRVPFNAETPYAVVHDHIYRELPLPSSINPRVAPEVDDVLIKALAKDPAQRYESAGAMIAAFEAAAGGTAPVQRATPQTRTRIAPAAVPTFHGLPITAPTPEGESKRVREQRPPRQRMQKNVEASIDVALENAGGMIERAGEKIGEALEVAFDTRSISELLPDEGEESIRRRVEAQYKKRSELVGHVIAYGVVNVLLWAIFAPTDLMALLGGAGAVGFPWPIFVTMGWGSGLLAHMIETYYATGSRDLQRTRIVRAELANTFGPDWMYTANKNEIKKVRRRAEAPFKKRVEFFQHIGVYLMINLMLWMLFIFSGAGFPWPLFVTAGWGIGLVADGYETLSATRRERAINREVERERQRLEEEWYGAEKPKRAEDDDDLEAPPIRLTEDGELTDSMVEEWQAEEKLKRR